MEDLIKKGLYELNKEYGIDSWHLEPFSDGWDKDLDIDELKVDLQRTRLSIEVKGVRYFFKDLKHYKAFKTKFNLL